MSFKAASVFSALFIGSIAVPTQVLPKDGPLVLEAAPEFQQDDNTYLGVLAEVYDGDDINLVLAAKSPEVSVPEADVSNFFYHTADPSRIVGGSVAAKGSAPYMVALTNGLVFCSFVCGGSLVSEQHVLTAAHCINALYYSGSLSWSLRINVGTNRWNRGGDSYRVARNITHQNYLASIIKNDIGILITSRKVVLSNHVSPVPLSFEFVDANVSARALGWGRTRHNGPISSELLELVVETIDGQTCVELVKLTAETQNTRAPPVEPHLELCAYHSPGQGMCNGDSGSALVRVDSQQQIGIVSWGFPCARGAPDMYARVSAFKHWLEQNLGYTSGLP